MANIGIYIYVYVQIHKDIDIFVCTTIQLLGHLYISHMSICLPVYSFPSSTDPMDLTVSVHRLFFLNSQNSRCVILAVSYLDTLNSVNLILLKKSLNSYHKEQFDKMSIDISIRILLRK
jgi:hypothetical protein